MEIYILKRIVLGLNICRDKIMKAAKPIIAVLLPCVESHVMFQYIHVQYLSCLVLFCFVLIPGKVSIVVSVESNQVIIFRNYKQLLYDIKVGS